MRFNYQHLLPWPFEVIDEPVHTAYSANSLAGKSDKVLDFVSDMCFFLV